MGKGSNTKTTTTTKTGGEGETTFKCRQSTVSRRWRATENRSHNFARLKRSTHAHTHTHIGGVSSLKMLSPFGVSLIFLQRRSEEGGGSMTCK